MSGQQMYRCLMKHPRCAFRDRLISTLLLAMTKSNVVNVRLK